MSEDATRSEFPMEGVSLSDSLPWIEMLYNFLSIRPSRFKSKAQIRTASTRVTVDVSKITPYQVYATLPLHSSMTEKAGIRNMRSIECGVNQIRTLHLFRLLILWKPMSLLQPVWSALSQNTLSHFVLSLCYVDLLRSRFCEENHINTNVRGVAVP